MSCRLRMYAHKPLSLILLFLGPITGLSAEPFAPTDSELRLLPPFCEAKIGADSRNEAAQQHWRNVFGPENWKHMHHYCFALNFMNRSFRHGGDRISANADLQRAINNFSYVLTHASKDFALRPEILVQKAKALHLRGEDDQVASLYMEAIAFKANYIPAYVALGDYYDDLGNIEKARQTYESGLKQNPHSRLLDRRLRRLTSKQ